MAVEAVASVMIHKLTKLLDDDPKTFEKFRDEIQNVLAVVSDMQSILSNAKQQEKSSKELKFLGNVYSLGDAMESFAIAGTYLKRGFVKKHSLVVANKFKLCREVPGEMEHSYTLSWLKSEMKKIREDISKQKDGITSLLMVQHQVYRSIRQHGQPWQDNDDYYAPNEEKSIFKKDVEKLQEQLTSSNRKGLQIISVFGEVGNGKTAHVKIIYNKLKKKDFQCSALVFVNTTWSVRQLMMAILQQVARLKVKEKLSDDVLRGRLYGFLKGQKYLIVIIDINSHELLEDLTGALPDSYNGSRVVITTSNEDAASFADASNRFHFKPLDREHSLKVFISKIWRRREIPFSSDRMEDLKKIIAESCAGTLLRISLLAGLLSTKGETYEQWSRVFEQSDFDTKSSSFDIYAFCYNDVPMHLKPCLLYMTLFPRGCEIPVRRLFRLWLAEGFVKPVRGIVQEDTVEGYLEEFVKRNMVEIKKRRSDESPKTCKMVDALHDILLPMALRIGLFHLHQKSDVHSNATAEDQFGIRRMVEYINIKDYTKLNALDQNMQSYISFNGRQKDMPAEEVGEFLKKVVGDRGFGLLKVLDLEGVYRPRLPENLGSLFHLKYLGLRWTFLDTLPSSLGSLLYLETLDIKHTRITTLPSSIWNLMHLHHLCLNGARLDIPAHSTIHRGPSQLQTLWGLFVDENIARKLGSTLSRMTNLRKLDITRQSSSTTVTTTTAATTTTTATTSHSSPYEEILSWISLLYSLQSLRLRSKDKMGRPAELILKPLSYLENLTQLYLLGHLRQSLSWYQFPPGLKVLTLSVSQLGEDPMPVLSQMQKLMVLRLLAASYVGEHMHFPENGFPSLRVLKLWKLEQLTTLTAGEGTMQKLHIMDIRCCEKLMELPLPLLKIESFDKLILTNMPEEFVSATKKNLEKHSTKIVENKLDF